jgi:hypothetical protein
MLWLWIESGATYAGSYAALRNEHEQQLAGTAIGRLLQGSGAVMHRRCYTCHKPPSGEPGSMQLPINYEAERQRRRRQMGPTGVHERIVVAGDPVARFGLEILVNFTRPEFSPLLLGPLAKSAGGYGSCGDVFQNVQDPDYQAILAAIREAKTVYDAEPRYATPGFKPNPQYVREMKRFGILPETFDRQRDSLDVFATDQAYWRSFW